MIKIGITHGDINGIGYEVIMKALADERITEICTPVIFGSAKLIGYYRKVLGTEPFPTNQVASASQARDGVVNLVNIASDEIKVDMGKPTEESGAAAFLSLQMAVEAFRAGEIDALVTAPVCKQCIHSDEFAMGHTEYLQKQFGGEGDRALMILFNDLMRVAVATTHLPIKDVPAAITKDLVLNKIEDFGKALTSSITVAPVVVIPETPSNRASAKERFKPSSIHIGIALINENNSQNRTIMTKPSRVRS